MIHTFILAAMARWYRFTAGKAFSITNGVSNARECAMKYLMLIAVTVLLAARAGFGADTFFLTAKNGEKYGPFEFKEGATLKVEGTEWTLVKERTVEQQVMERLANIMIPEIEFREANIHDVVAFLNKASQEADKTAKRGEPKVSIMLNPGETPPATDKEKMITMQVHRVSMKDALDYITNLAGLKYRVGGNVVTLVRPGDKEAGEFTMRIYTIEPTFHGSPRDIEEDKFKNSLISMGITRLLQFREQT